MNIENLSTAPPDITCVDEVNAYYFAMAAHAAIDQRRRYTNEPYINHPLQVYNLVKSVGGDTHMLMAALLHDVVEDTKVTNDCIVEAFGADVALLVAELTDVSKMEDGNRSIRKAIDCQHLSQASPRGKTIKLADLICNTSSIVEYDVGFAHIYLRDKYVLLKVLTEGDSELWNAANTLLHLSAAKINTDLSRGNS